jgi:hypothetical protein
LAARHRTDLPRARAEAPPPALVSSSPVRMCEHSETTDVESKLWIVGIIISIAGRCVLFSG